jgi:hypothetical protein
MWGGNFSDEVALLAHAFKKIHLKRRMTRETMICFPFQPLFLCFVTGMNDYIYITTVCQLQDRSPANFKATFV